MFLGKLFKSVSKKYSKIYVKDISFDSRNLKKGDIFFAIKGNNFSGINYVNHAIKKGAVAIICNKKIKYNNSKIPLIISKNIRKSLSETCSKLYKKKPNNIIAVTGTNGKSSVVNFFYQILNINKIPVATIGTLGIISKNYKKKTKLTSIDSLSLHRNLEILAKNKVNNVILEASSHGLSQRRLDGLNINAGIFTNFSHDHLDYHKTMKSYFSSKMYLFRNLLHKNSKIITDENNKEFKFLKKIAKNKKIKKFTIGIKKGDIKILDNSYKNENQIVKLSIKSKIFLIKIPLIGYFQIKNLFMAVLAAALCAGIDIKKILKQLHKIKPVTGRLECVKNIYNNSKIIVDFAHTPDALENSLSAIKKQFKKKIVLVFGCGGERDKKKRLLMGKIANKYCRKVFVTDDNPRNENPKKIRNAIIKGCSHISEDIGNRKKAITSAIKELHPNEILLISGKGHEETQNYGNKIIKFSDKKIIKEIIRNKILFIKKNGQTEEIAKKVFENKKFNKIKYNGVSINTKTLKKNNLFFAIKGKNNDGHNFASEAINKGAARSVVNKKNKKLNIKKFIKVKNTLSSLNNLAKIVRSNFSGSVIGITGSVGKTTLKNLTGFALKNYGKVYQSPHSYNNKYGVPFSLANLKNDAEFGVFEIGMDKKGEIHSLSKMIKPRLGVITNISEAHFKNFNYLKDIANAKSEIINNILDGGDIVLNKDSKFFNFLLKKAKKKKINIISFSSKKKADITLLGIKKYNYNYKLKIKVKNEIFYIETKYAANNFIKNILACISILYSLNLDLNKVKKIFNSFELPSGRGDIKIVRKYKKKFKFIDESYNANPASMKSAIRNMNYFKKKKNEKKLVFFGDMLELGNKSKKLHRELASLINQSNIDKVFVYGNHIKETFNLLSKNKKGKVFNSFKDARLHFSKIIHNNDLLMIKGSNATGLNMFSKSIKKRSAGVI